MSQLIDQDPGQTALPELLHPGSRALFRHWERIRGERSAPDRADVDLRAIVDLLSGIGILERHKLPTTFRWRVAGSGVCAVWGADVTGHDMLAAWSGVERYSLIAVFNGVVDRLQPFVARFKASTTEGDVVGVEFLSMPVRAEASDVVQILCSVLPFRDAAWLSRKSPRRFELSSVRTIWTEPLPGDPLTSRHGAGKQAGVTAQPFRVIRGGRAD